MNKIWLDALHFFAEYLDRKSEIWQHVHIAARRYSIAAFIVTPSPILSYYRLLTTNISVAKRVTICLKAWLLYEIDIFQEPRTLSLVKFQIKSTDLEVSLIDLSVKNDVV